MGQADGLRKARLLGTVILSDPGLWNLKTLKYASLPLQHLNHPIEVLQGRVLNQDLAFSSAVSNPHPHSQRCFQRPLCCAHIRILPPRSARFPLQRAAGRGLVDQHLRKQRHGHFLCDCYFGHFRNLVVIVQGEQQPRMTVCQVAPP